MDTDIPEDAGDVFTSGQQEPSDILIRRPVDRGGDEKIFYYGRGSASFIGHDCRAVTRHS